MYFYLAIESDAGKSDRLELVGDGFSAQDVTARVNWNNFHDVSKPHVIVHVPADGDATIDSVLLPWRGLDKANDLLDHLAVMVYDWAHKALPGVRFQV